MRSLGADNRCVAHHHGGPALLEAPVLRVDLSPALFFIVLVTIKAIVA
ncbi:MAG: hypothetical protein JWM64_1032 [Frankiales bacterium]|nr:hypothetical protein [Frankiales bacterium]